MADLLAERPRVSDLRGSATPSHGSAVLEDPSGKRRRRLRLLGRSIALVLTLWLVALVLGGVGLRPVPGIPFSGSLRPAVAPPVVKKLPPPRPASRADLAPARPASDPSLAGVPIADRTVTTKPKPKPTAQRPARAPVVTVRSHGKAPTRKTTLVQPGANTAPGQTTKSSPSTITAHPNQGKHTGKSTTTTTTPTTTSTSTTTTPGKSGSAHGKTGTSPGSTHGASRSTP